MFDWGRNLYDRYAAEKPNCCRPMYLATDIDMQILAKASKDSIESTNCEYAQRQNVPVFDAIERTSFVIKTKSKRRVHFKQHDL